MKVYKPKEFSLLLGVCVKTLQRWDNIGLLKAKRSLTNRRYYTQEDVDKYFEDYLDY